MGMHCTRIRISTKQKCQLLYISIKDTLIFIQIFIKQLIKRIQRSPTAKRYLKVLFVIFCIYLWIILIKFPREREQRSKELTEYLTKTLGTRITAVRLKPNENTTRLQPSFKCNKETFGVIMIMSAADNFARRETQRNTWIKDLPVLSNAKMETFFFIGIPADQNITQDLMYESNLYHDIIIDDLKEEYYLLTLKTLRMAKWFSANCLNVSYMIKTDDDMFLNVPNIIKHISSVPNSWVNYIGGNLRLDAPVERDPYTKWFAPYDWWPEETYPPFITGALTVIASETVPALLNACLNVPLFHIEDVYLTGILGFEKLHIVPQRMPGVISGCPRWKIILKMALFPDFVKTSLAFHTDGDIEFINQLYDLTTRV